MDSNNKFLIKALFIGIIIISLITFTGCTTEEEDKKDGNGNGDGNGDGDGGDGNGDNNTTKPDELVKFKDVRHTPDNPNLGDEITFEVTTESQNYIENLECLICIKDSYCFTNSPEMTRINNPSSNSWTGKWTVPTENNDVTHGTILEYHFYGKDSLDNELESETHSISVQ